MRLTLKLIYCTLVLFWWFDFGTGTYYVILFTTLFFFLIKYGVRLFRVANVKEDCIAFSFLVVWFYGVIIGLLNGNNTNYIISNFAGMTCYSFYFVLAREKPDPKRIVWFLLYGGGIMALYSIITFLFFFLGIEVPFSARMDVASTGQSRIYFSTLAIAFPLLGASFYSIINKTLFPVIGGKWLWFVISFVGTLVISASKGFLLGGLFVLLSILSFSFLAVFSKKNTISFLLLLLFLFSFMYCIFDAYEVLDVFSAIFDKDDMSNVTRYNQLDVMLKNLSLFGNGLGAVIPELSRSDDAPYGFELVYINLIHKFGFMSLFLFGGWVYMMIRSFRNCLQNHSIWMNTIVLSSLGYLLVALGNPLLMHPCLVVMNASSLYILRTVNKRKLASK